MSVKKRGTPVRIGTRTRTRATWKVGVGDWAGGAWGIEVRFDVAAACGCVRASACPGPRVAGRQASHRGAVAVVVPPPGASPTNLRAGDELMPDALADDIRSGDRLRCFVRHLKDCDRCHDAYLTLCLYLSLYRPDENP